MGLIQILILAIVQGLTEFIPVSSSAHLILVPMFVPGWEDQGPLIDIASHFGTLGAVMLYFRTRTLQLIAGGVDTLRFRDTPDRRLFLFLAVATVPIIIVGGLLYAFGTMEYLRSPLVLGVTSIVFGILLWVSDRAAVTASGLTWPRILMIGLAQCLALIPGASRSGVTITAGRWLGLSRPEAAEISMLLSIPVILVFSIVAGLELATGNTNADTGAALLVAVASFVSGLIAIDLFMRMTRHMSFTPFVIYRLVLGAVLIGVSLF